MNMIKSASYLLCLDLMHSTTFPQFLWRMLVSQKLLASISYLDLNLPLTSNGIPILSQLQSRQQKWLVPFIAQKGTWLHLLYSTSTRARYDLEWNIAATSGQVLHKHHCLLLMQSRNAFVHWLEMNYLAPYNHFLIGVMSLASLCSIVTFMVGVQTNCIKWFHPSKSLSEVLDWLAAPINMSWTFRRRSPISTLRVFSPGQLVSGIGSLRAVSLTPMTWASSSHEWTNFSLLCSKNTHSYFL